MHVQRVIPLVWVMLVLVVTTVAAAVEPSQFSISYMDRAPRIDGVIHPDEWKRASAITGGVPYGSNSISANQATFWLGWNEASIFLAMRSYFRPGIRPDFASRTMSDNLELGFFPEIAALQGPRRIFTNGHACWPDPITGEWATDLKTAGRTFIDPDNTYGFGTTVWEVEARFPADRFPLPRENRAGDKWRLLLVRNFTQPWMQVVLPVSHGFLNPEGYTRATLTREQPTVQFTNVLPLLQGRAAPEVRICNPTDAAVTVSVSLTIETGAGVSLFQRREDVTVAPKSSHLWQPDEELKGITLGDQARIRLAVCGADGTSLLKYAAAFTLDKYLMQVPNRIRPCVLPEVDSIVYSRYPAGMFIDRGTGATKITYRSGSYAMPRLSPDGNRVLFTSYDGEEKAVWIVDVNERRPRLLARGEQPSWMPNGDAFVFVLDGALYSKALGSAHRRDGGADKAAGADDRRLLTSTELGKCRFPSVSPDGQQVLFVAGEESRGTLYAMGLEDLKLRAITSGEILSPPAWSPDGRLIAFQDGARLYVTDLTGNRRLLVSEAGVQACPVWSSDGNGLAYCQADTPHGPWDLRAIDIGRVGASALLQREVDAGADIKWHCKPMQGEPPAPTVTHRSKGGAVELAVDGRPALSLVGIAAAAKAKVRPATTGIVVSGQNTAVRIVGDFQALVIPDRLGDDIVIREAPQTLDLSHTALVLAMLRNDAGMAVFAVPAEDRRIMVKAPGSLELSVTAGSGVLGVGLVQEAKPSAVPGEWRLVVPQCQSARMVSGTAETVQKVLAEEYPECEKDDVLCYRFARQSKTPRSVWSVTDVVLDLVGIEPSRRALMQQEVTTIRKARHNVCYPTVALTTEAITAAYRSYNFTRWAPGDIKHWLEDVQYLLDAEDSRLEEYAAFADAARRAGGKLATADRGLSDKVEELLNRLVEMLQKREGFLSPEKVAAAAAALEKNGASHLDTYSKIANEAADQRTEVLQQCRQQVRAIRNTVARALLHTSDAHRPAALELYELTTSVLRYRHYVEDDWRGEQVQEPYARPWWKDIW